MSKFKYKANYTEKPYNGSKSKLFTTKERAEKFIEKNKDTIYWSQVVEIDPKSDKPRPIIDNSIDLESQGHKKMEGTLDNHFETGMECLGLVFIDSSIKGNPNPNFDPNKPECGSNFRYHASYDALHFINKDMVLEIDGVKYVMIKDRSMYSRDGYRLSFYPQGFDPSELLQLFDGKTKATLYVKDKK